MRRPIAFALSAAVLALVPAGASASVFTGSLADPAGDASMPGADITGASIQYDDATGAATARVTFEGGPSAADGFVVVFVGARQSNGTCRGGFLLGTSTAPGTTAAAFGQDKSSGTTGAATRAQDGATVTISATDTALAGYDGVDCLQARVTRQGQAATIYDDTTPGAATAPAPPPTTSTPTTTTPTTTTPTTPPDPVPPKPRPTPLERYDAAIAACAKRARSRRASCRRTAARRNRAGASLAAKRRRNPLIGRVFVGIQADVAGVCGGICYEGFAFSDDRFAYRGLAEDGPALARCRSTTVKRKGGDGCLPYRWNRRTRTFTADGERWKLSRDGRKLERKGEVDLFRMAIPAPGTRVAVALTSISSFGSPAFGQTFSNQDLALDTKGRFVLDSSVSGTTGVNTGVETSFVALPAARKGRYAFEPGGTFTLFFADGRVVRRSAVVSFGDKGKRPVITRDGLILDASFYRVPDAD